MIAGSPHRAPAWRRAGACTGPHRRPGAGAGAGLGQGGLHGGQQGAQPGERGGGEGGGGVPSGVADRADAAGWPALRVPYGHGHGDQALLHPLVVHGPLGALRAGDHARRAAVRGQQVADAEDGGHGAAADHLRDEADAVAVRHRHRHRLVEFVGDQLGERLERVGHAAARQIGVAEPHEPGRELDVPARRAEQAEAEEGAHDPVDGGAGQSGGVYEVAGTQPPAAGRGHRADHGEAAFQRAGHRHRAGDRRGGVVAGHGRSPPLGVVRKVRAGIRS